MTKAARTRPGTKKAAARTKGKGDRLATYRKKRDFTTTPEPAPAKAALRSAAAPLEFVVQKHDATRLHYDVRIEIGGAMMSWAVPKGPSYDPAVKRLAVETEDHPMEYNRFEGRIPDGGYGAGDVLIWDRGTYETVPPGQEKAMREKGHLKVHFHGEKLEGEWHFVRTSGRGHGKEGDANKPSWLMFKGKDAEANPDLDIVAARPESVVSGKSATRGPRRRGASPSGHSAAELLKTIGAPMRAVAVAGVSDPDAYHYEVKLDGYRLVGALVDGEVRLVTRRGNDWTDRFRPIAQALAGLSAREAVVDGEACILDERGVSAFERLQAWLSGEEDTGTLAFAIFDLLWLDGRDLRERPIEERRELLAALLAKAPPPLVFSKELDPPLADVLPRARAAGLEGLIAKRKRSPYGSTGAWWKLKFRREQEVALAGYVPRTDAVDEVGALVIALATPDGSFAYGGRVGTGFDQKTRRKLARALDALHSERPTVHGSPRIPGVRWAEVKLVAEIRLADWTRDGAARGASFVALREDKLPADCLREEEVAVDGATKTTRASKRSHAADDRLPTARARTAAAKTTNPPARDVPLTNPTKVLFPRDGITKAEIADYYAAIAPEMLPHLSGRPIGLQRWPNGIDDKAWFQQNAPPTVPDYVRILDTGPEHGSDRKMVVENVETLLWLANLAALTIHEWASHVPKAATTREAIVHSLAQADYSVLDLDPGDGPWDHVVQVADTLRGLLDELHLESVVKTSGQRGLHIVVPFKRGPSHAAATEFARKLATAVAEALPSIATVERMKAKRGGRLYIDFLQNGHGKTIVAPYTVRAKDGAPVSTPLAWSEVTRRLDPSAFTIRTVRKRVDKVGDLLAPLLTPTQSLPSVR